MFGVQRRGFGGRAEERVWKNRQKQKQREAIAAAGTARETQQQQSSKAQQQQKKCVSVKGCVVVMRSEGLGCERHIHDTASQPCKHP